MPRASQVLVVSKVLLIAAALLIVWGAFVFVTGDYVATLDIAAGLVSAGVIVAALATIARALERLPDRLAEFAPVRPITGLDIAGDDIDREIEPEIEAESFPIPPAGPLAKPPPAPVPAPPAQQDAAPAGPTLVREGVIDGRVYRYYDDGSIHADEPDGPRRYASIDDLRAEILGRAERRPAAAAAAPAVAASAAGLGAARDWEPRLDQPAEPYVRVDHGDEDAGYDAGDLRRSFDENEVLPDPHVEEERGSSWAGPFRSLLSRNRRDRGDPATREDDSEPRF